MAIVDPIEDIVFQEALRHWFNDAAVQGILTTDAKMNVRGWNRWLEVNSGHSAADVVGRNLFDLYPEIAERRLDSYFENALSGQVCLLSQRLHHYLIPMQAESDSPRKQMQQSVRISPLIHADRVVGTIAIINDVTERVERESQLQRQVKILAALQDISEAVLANPVLDDLFKELPDRICKVFGVDSIAILLRENKDLILHGSRGLDETIKAGFRVPIGEAYTGRIASERRPIVIDDISKTTDYEFAVKWLGANSLAGTPLLIKGEVTGVICLGSSQAGRFTSEDVRLLQLVADRVALGIDHTHLYEAERHARAHAEASNRLKDEFLATVSHELRTPLSSILGWIELLKSRRLDAAATTTAIETIGRNAVSQKDLINDLLDVSRIIAGKLTIRFERVDLAAILGSAIETVRPSSESKEIQIISEINPISGTSLGDESRLQQVFWNLLTNAIKFTPKGGTIAVGLKAVDGQAEVSITDTGIGIKPDLLPYVFDRFRQADGSTTRRHGGLGLGLSIVRHLVELHGGTAFVTSPGDGKGSTFQVKLPLKPEYNENEPSSVYSQNGYDLPDPNILIAPLLADLNILVVEDDPDTRDWLKVVLGQYGSQVTTAGSSTEALRILANTSQDVIVSDIGMPAEDGYELIRKVRSLEGKNRRIPAIALTAYASIQDRLRVVEAGFQIHLSKPIDSAELITTISNLRNMR